MSHVELVIKIPEEAYKVLKNTGVDWLGAEHILSAVANGTLLPEGHGDLVDIETLIDMFWDGNSMEITKYDLSVIEPIIEADTESEDKE